MTGKDACPTDCVFALTGEGACRRKIQVHKQLYDCSSSIFDAKSISRNLQVSAISATVFDRLGQKQGLEE